MKKADEKLKKGMYQMGKKHIGKALSKCNIHSVSDMFSFAKHLKENYDYYDNTDKGDVYIHKGNKLKYTEDKIYLTWYNYR